ncbi:MAG: hypothetical protein AB7U61_07975 [Methylocystis sp.]
MFSFKLFDGATIFPLPRFRRSRVAIFGVLGLAACWLVISHSYVAYLSSNSPGAALEIRKDDSQSILRLAADALLPASEDHGVAPGSVPLSPARNDELRQQVEAVLISEPLSARACRLLGQIAEIDGSASNAEKFMHAAARRSLSEKIAIDWMMRNGFERKSYRSTAYYADTLLRSTPGIAGHVTPILARMAETPDAKPEIIRLLAANPNWRREFFGALGASVADARTPLDLFLRLKDSPAPPTTDELNFYESFLFNHKLYALAYYAWLQFLPPAKLESAGHIFNGDFEGTPSGSRFDWRSPSGANVVVDVASRPEAAKNQALVVQFGPGRVEFPGVSQAIMLAPGAYALKGSFMGDIRGPRGVQWSAKCMDGALLGQSQMILGSFSAWRDLEFPLVVPQTGCAAQMIELQLAARSPSEKLLSGAIWFDDFSIVRKGEVGSQ